MERFGLFARFGFMHLVATNLALWVRTIIWESANEWIHHIYKDKGGIDEPLALAGETGVGIAPFAGDNGPIALGLRSVG